MWSTWRPYNNLICAFRVRFRGRTIRVHMDRDGAAYSLLDGEPVTILTPAGELKL